MPKEDRLQKMELAPQQEVAVDVLRRFVEGPNDLPKELRERIVELLTKYPRPPSKAKIPVPPKTKPAPSAEQSLWKEASPTNERGKRLELAELLKAAKANPSLIIQSQSLHNLFFSDVIDVLSVYFRSTQDSIRSLIEKEVRGLPNVGWFIRFEGDLPVIGNFSKELKAIMFTYKSLNQETKLMEAKTALRFIDVNKEEVALTVQTDLSGDLGHCRPDTLLWDHKDDDPADLVGDCESSSIAEEYRSHIGRLDRK